MGGGSVWRQALIFRFWGIACVDAKLKLISLLFRNQALCEKVLAKAMKHSLATEICFGVFHEKDLFPEWG